MARPKKRSVEEIEAEINAEAGMPMVHKDAQIAVLDKEAEEGIPTDFNDAPEYTMQVIADSGFDVDLFRLPKPDPAYEYRHLRSDAKNMSKKTSALLYQMGGWQVCPKTHLLKIGIKEEMLGVDGAYHVGEHILAFMPKKLYLQKKNEEQHRNDIRQEAIKRRIEEGDEDAGGVDREKNPSMRGIQHERKLKGNTKWGR